MKFDDLIRQAGWCCPWAYFSAHAKVRTGLLAARLGVSEATIRDWKRYVAQKQVTCRDRRMCLIAAGILTKTGAVVEGASVTPAGQATPQREGQ